jgi:hypothetical protein
MIGFLGTLLNPINLGEMLGGWERGVAALQQIEFFVRLLHPTSNLQTNQTTY